MTIVRIRAGCRQLHRRELVVLPALGICAASVKIQSLLSMLATIGQKMCRVTVRYPSYTDVYHKKEALT